MEELVFDFNITMVIISLLASAICMIILAVYILIKSHGGPVVHWFVRVQFLLLLWTTFHIFELLAPDIRLKWIVVCVELFGVCFFGVTFYMFARAYEGKPKPSVARLLFIFSPSIIIYISVLTNPLHGLFYRSFNMRGATYGPFCWASIIVATFYLIIGVYQFTCRNKHKSIYHTKQLLYLGSAVFFPMVLHLLSVIGVMDYGFNLVLTVLPFSLTLVTISVLKYQFLDILPYTLTEVVESIDDGFLVVSTKRDIEDYNISFFERFIDIAECKTFDDILTMLSEVTSNKVLLDNLNYSLNVKKENYVSGEVTFTKDHIKVTAQYTTKAISDIHGVKIATIITFHDITDIQNLYTELEGTKQELMRAKNQLEDHIATIQMLTIENERNKLMSEVHDILAHSMTELLALLEKCDMILSRGKASNEEATSAIEGTLLSARDSLAEIRESVSKFKKMGV